MAGTVAHGTKMIALRLPAASATLQLRKIESSGLRPLSVISLIGSTPFREDRTTLVFDPRLSEPRTV